MMLLISVVSAGEGMSQRGRKLVGTTVIQAMSLSKSVSRWQRGNTCPDEGESCLAVRQCRVSAA